jgi:dTDP-4-dehydrorhamnose 3,5-epimerase
MKFHETPCAGSYLIELEPFADDRGFFARAFCAREFSERGLVSAFLQVNNSFSARRGTLRGMHFQLPPRAETKMVRCVRGALWDCLLDLRTDSPTRGRWYGTELSAENRKMLYVPKGFAHGFITLCDDTEMLYFVDEVYDPGLERGVRWDDAAFGIEWPIAPTVISEKDRRIPDYQAP